LTLDPTPFLEPRPLKYPASEVYHFVPLDEHVPVYQKPFQLVLEVAIADSAAARRALDREGTFTIKATLDYQACDDRVCFKPVSIPLSWTVKVRRAGGDPVDSARASPERG
jgi:hypothetical protein